MLLYLHPAGHLNDLVVPAGAVSCVNSVSCEKLGRYAFEVRAEEIAKAKIVALDLHWALALPSFERLLALVRRVNPRVPVVVGGITAGHYAREISLRCPVDFVTRGDSETSFRALVEAVEEGRKPPALANTFSRGKAAGPERRMTQAEFDATDCLTVDWFPTYLRVTDLDTPAFISARTIPLARGCCMRCPTCYGSYSGTFGPGVLYRSPAGAALQLRRASELGARNLRLFMGKPPADLLRGWLRALAEKGPYRFSTRVGIFLCRPPASEDLAALEAAFPDGVALTMVSPAEHTPRLAPERRAAERAAWQKVSSLARSSGWLNLDVWTMTGAGLERERRFFTPVDPPRAPVGSRNVTVSFGAVWQVTRPNSQGRVRPLEALRRPMSQVWTFYAARLLSPALSCLLVPFRYLDELDSDPASLPPPRDRRRVFFERIMKSWRTHKLPLLPDLRLALIGVSPLPGSSGAGSFHGVRLKGDLRYLPPGSFSLRRPPTPRPLELVRDHRGEELRAAVSIERAPERPQAQAFMPLPPAGHPFTAAWARSIASHGLLALVPPPGSAGGQGALRVTLRVQQASVVLLDGSSSPVAQGRADLGYLRDPRAGDA